MSLANFHWKVAEAVVVEEEEVAVADLEHSHRQMWWIGLVWIELVWIELVWIELVWIELVW